MTLQQLVYFREIAFTLSFTRAAEKLYTTQPSLSRAINMLESELGVPLFTRQNGKKIQLTRFGQALLPHVEAIFQEIEAGKERLNLMKDPLHGVVRIAYEYINAEPLVLDAFRRYYKDDVNRSISLQFDVSDNPRHLWQLVENNLADIVFSPAANNVSIDSVQIAKLKLFVYLASDHPLAGRDSLTLEDIQAEPLLGYQKEEVLIKKINELFDSCGYEANFVDFHNSMTALMSYVSMGIGITILPEFPTHISDVILIPLEHPESYLDFFMCWSASNPLSPAAEHIRNYCIRYYSEQERK